jgi:hypothetical protein
LAASPLSDDELIAELTNLSRGQSRELRYAIRFLEEFSFPFELTKPNRAWRGLKAVLENRPIEVISSVDRRRMTSFDGFADLDRTTAFQELLALEPRLRNLEEDARSSRGTDSGSINYIGDVEGLLEPIVGPESHQDNELLSSKIAMHSAVVYLEELAGLFDD